MVRCFNSGNFGVAGHNVERVHKIEIGFGFDSLQDRRWQPHFRLIPSHVRHFVLPWDVKPYYFTGNDPQAFVSTPFVADVKQ